MILEIIQQILGIILFFLPGILLSYIILPKTDIIKRTVYSIVLAVSISTILGVFLYLLNLLTAINTILSLISLILLFLLFLILKSKDKPFTFSEKVKGKKYKTDFNKDIWYLIFFSLIGTIWRILFLKSIKNFGAAYKYAGKFIGETIPDLGFYTGMAIDHSRYIGGKVASSIFNFLSINNLYLELFLITFIFLGFIYLIFSEYRNKKLAFVGVALMTLGPIEIFHTTLSIRGSPLSYISLFSLFLLFKLKEKKIFWIALLLAIAMMFTYYTASMAILLTSIGFIIALFIKELIKTKSLTKTFKNSLKNKKIRAFLLIVIIVASYIYIFSNMRMYTFSRSQEFSGLESSYLTIIEPISTTKLTTKIPLNYYKGPSFFRLSAIGWQEVFFFLCGLTFIFHIMRKITKKEKFSEENLDLLLCLIPVLIVSYGFFHVNLPTRIFDYFAFFGLLVIKIPKKYLKIFFILSFIFILITSFYVAKDKKIFFETSNEEIEGAKEIANSLQGKIFSDQSFINQLILNDRYNVTGAYDDDIIVHNLFYQDNSSIFLDTINTLDINLNVDYIVLTKRMQEQYILMLNVPQKPLTNINLYEENLNKVYDNGDVKVYEIKNET